MARNKTKVPPVALRKRYVNEGDPEIEISFYEDVGEFKEGESYTLHYMSAKRWIKRAKAYVTADGPDEEIVRKKLALAAEEEKVQAALHPGADVAMSSDDVKGSKSDNEPSADANDNS
jgi:hypothetical protein